MTKQEQRSFKLGMETRKNGSKNCSRHEKEVRKISGKSQSKGKPRKGKRQVSEGFTYWVKGNDTQVVSRTRKKRGGEGSKERMKGTEKKGEESGGNGTGRRWREPSARLKRGTVVYAWFAKTEGACI